MNARTDNDAMIPPLRAPAARDRSAAQLWEQYQVEKELAARLRNASQMERRKLYTTLYDELFRRIPHHAQLIDKVSPQQRAARISAQLRFLDRFLDPGATLLEIGAGDCALSLHVAPRVRKVYALDVSSFITQGIPLPDNFELILSDGVSVPVPDGSITVAYSNQLMEHLHPQDAAEQLANIFRAIAPGGAYVCITPSRFTGPHDISRYFADTAHGFHLKEYTISELREIMRKAGFRRTAQYARVRSVCFAVPGWLTRMMEKLCDSLSPRMRARLCRNAIARALLDIRLVAWK